MNWLFYIYSLTQQCYMPPFSDWLTWVQENTLGLLINRLERESLTFFCNFSGLDNSITKRTELFQGNSSLDKQGGGSLRFVNPHKIRVLQLFEKLCPLCDHCKSQWEYYQWRKKVKSTFFADTSLFGTLHWKPLAKHKFVQIQKNDDVVSYLLIFCQKWIYNNFLRGKLLL